MWLVRLRKPRAEPRRCSRRPLIASVGPLDVHGRSKQARTSEVRCFSVRPSRRSSIKVVGTPLATEAIEAVIAARPRLRSWSRWLLFNTKNPTSQRVFINEESNNSGEEWIRVNSPVRPVSDVDLRPAASILWEKIVGDLVIVDEMVT
jgi:uncharacterized protein (DUF2132 family)